MKIAIFSLSQKQQKDKNILHSYSHLPSNPSMLTVFVDTTNSYLSNRVSYDDLYLLKFLPISSTWYIFVSSCSLCTVPDSPLCRGWQVHQEVRLARNNWINLELETPGVGFVTFCPTFLFYNLENRVIDLIWRRRQKLLGTWAMYPSRYTTRAGF